MVCERADDARCGHHRRWPQRSCLLRLSGDGRSQGIGARSAPRRRGRRGYGRVQPRLSQFSRIVRCFSIEPKNHSRPQSRHPWTADRRAPDIQLPAFGRRKLFEGRRRPHETRGCEILGTGCRSPGRLSNTFDRHCRCLACQRARDATKRRREQSICVVGNYASPYTPGSAYVLLHHSFGEVNGKKGVWGHAIGGMGAITQAMAKAAAARGVDIRLATRVRQVLVENGRAIGVETDKGETIRATAVAAGINPKLLYLHLVDARALPEGFRRRMENWRCGSGTFRMNV